jgi:hypothetical protein
MTDNEDRLSGTTKLGPILRWPTVRAKAWTKSFLTTAINDPNIIAIVAVGSAIRQNVSSVDIDLVVICENPRSLTNKPPIEVDLRAYPVATVEPQIESGQDMLGWAVKFGRVLFQRNSFWDKVVESWLHRLPLPSHDLARQRATDAYNRLLKVLQLGDEDAVREQALSYVTHLARAQLLERGIYPASRPELASQLRACGVFPLAEVLDETLGGVKIEFSRFERLSSQIA